MPTSVLRIAGQTFVVSSRNGGQTWPLPLDRCRGPAASIGDAARHSHRHRRSIQANSADLPRQHRTAVCTTTASPRLGRGKRIQQRAVSAVTVELIEAPQYRLAVQHRADRVLHAKRRLAVTGFGAPANGVPRLARSLTGFSVSWIHRQKSRTSALVARSQLTSTAHKNLL